MLKRNDSRLNRHNRIQLQGLRANIDIQPIIDHNACLEYITKYAAKSEKVSDVVREAFNKVLCKVNENDCGSSIIRKLIIKSVGERDFSIQEIMHYLLSLKLHSSTFTVISTSLEGSRKVTIKSDCLQSDSSHLNYYATSQY